MSEPWNNAYVGIPFEPRGASHAGADCYGLVRLIYRERLRLELPSYGEDYVTAEEFDDLDRLIGSKRDEGPWFSIAAGSERAFDVVMIQYDGFVTHLGVVVRPGVALHVMRGRTSERIRYRAGLWANRVAGFQRHVACAGYSLS